MNNKTGQFKNITLDTLNNEHLCCAIADKKHQCGVDTKKAWLKDRIAERHVFRKLDEKGKVFIEYAPLETAWVPVHGNNYIYILTIYYGVQCPYIPNCIEQIKNYCLENHIPLELIAVDSLEKAKAVPCVFNNWAVFYNGNFETVHLLNEGYLKKLLGL